MLTMNTRILLLSFLLSVLCHSHLAAEDWAQWRGPDRRGVIRNSPPLINSLEGEELKLVWEMPFPPRGASPYYSSPVAANGKVYMHLSPLATLAPPPVKKPEKPKPKKKKDELDDFLSADVSEEDDLPGGMPPPKIRKPKPSAAKPQAQKNRKNPNMDDVLLCVNLADGKELWRFARYGGPGKWGAPNTPCVHGGKVSFLGNKGIVYCLDAETGKDQWTSDALTKQRAAFVASPIVIGGKLIVPVQTTIALNIADGTTLWEAPIGVRSGSPTVWTNGGKSYVIVAGDEIACIDPDNGKVLWKIPGGRLSVSPAVSGDRLAIMYAGKGQGPTVYRMTLSGAEKESEFSYKPAGMGHQTCTPSMDGDLLYAWGSRTSFCYDMAAKRKLWEGASPGDGKPSPIMADKKMILNNSKRVLILDAGSGKTLASANVRVAGCTSCGIAGDRLIVNSGTHLRCYNIGAAGN